MRLYNASFCRELMSGNLLMIAGANYAFRPKKNKQRNQIKSFLLDYGAVKTTINDQGWHGHMGRDIRV